MSRRVSDVSQLMSTKPRPRPRPKPVAAQPSKKDDDDAFFVRNQSRTTSTWSKLDKLNKEKKAVSTASDGEEEEPKPRKKSEEPRWQKKKKLLVISGLSDDEDSVGETDDTPKRRKHDDKRRARSRSRSITPPPEIPFHQLQTAADIVRDALGIVPRAPSPTDFEGDDSTDAIISDPELVSIVKNARSELRNAPPAAASQSGSEDSVILHIRWKPHPLNEAGVEQDFSYKITRTDNFRELYEAVADDVSVLSENLIITHHGKRVFPSVTPSSLGIWDKATFVACDQRTYEYVKNQARAPIAAPEPEEDSSVLEIVSDTDEAPHMNDEESDAGAESEADGDTFKLTLRSALTTRDIILTVRPTTKCGAIVQAFLKKAGLANNYSSSPKKRKKKGGPDPRLCIDGDRMDNDTEIGDMDLEDGDLVEVIGL